MNTPEQRAAERIQVDLSGWVVGGQLIRDQLTSIIAAEFADERKVAKEKADLLNMAILQMRQLQSDSEAVLSKLQSLVK